MVNYILDASAVLAFLFKEEGAEEVEKFLNSGTKISWINVTEVVRKLRSKGFETDLVALLESTGLGCLPYGSGEAQEVITMGLLQKNLSLGDCACLATAKRYGLTVITGDRMWSKLELPVDIHLFR